MVGSQACVWSPSGALDLGQARRQPSSIEPADRREAPPHPSIGGVPYLDATGGAPPT